MFNQVVGMLELLCLRVFLSIKTISFVLSLLFFGYQPSNIGTIEDNAGRRGKSNAVNRYFLVDWPLRLKDDYKCQARLERYLYH